MKNQTKILLWSSNLWYFSAGLLGPLFAIFTEQIGGDILDISSAWAIYLIISGFLTILVGKFADKIGPALLLFAGYTLNTVFTFGYLFIETPAQLFILQACFGIANALANPTWSALYDTYSDDTKNGYLWGLSYGYADVFTGIAAILGGIIITYASFQALFIAMGTIQIFATLLQARMYQMSKR